MGFLDDLFNRGSKAIDEVVAKSNVTGEAKELFEDLEKEATNVFGQVSDMAQSAVNNMSSGTSRQGGYQSDSGSNVPQMQTQNNGGSSSGFDGNFSEKLRKIVSEAGEYEIDTNFPIDQMEREFGGEIYKRKIAMAAPNSISYVLSSGGRKILYIRHWRDYQAYNRAANRGIKKYCDRSGVKMLDFFDYLPNEYGYMRDRIQTALKS